MSQDCLPDSPRRDQTQPWTDARPKPTPQRGEWLDRLLRLALPCMYAVPVVAWFLAIDGPISISTALWMFVAFVGLQALAAFSIARGNW